MKAPTRCLARGGVYSACGGGDDGSFKIVASERRGVDAACLGRAEARGSNKQSAGRKVTNSQPRSKQAGRRVEVWHVGAAVTAPVGAVCGYLRPYTRRASLPLNGELVGRC